MNLRAIFTTSLFIRSYLVVSLFLLIFIASVSFKHQDALKDSTELLVKSYKIQVKLEQLLSYVKDAETGQRGFIISRDTVFLQPYTSARALIEKPYLELRSLISNNVRQNYNLDSLQVLINLRFSLLAISLKLIESPEVNNKLLDQNLLRGKSVMDQIRNLVNEMSELEVRYFEDHEKKYSHELSFTPLSTLFLTLFSLFVFVLSFIKINKDLGIVTKTNADLRLTTESFKQAEEIGKFSSWQWHIDSDKYVFSDNQYGLLGVEPKSFEPTMENFLKFVHPEDRHLLTDASNLAINEKKLSATFYRIIRNDGELRYFKSFAKLTDFHDKQIFIGINSDITELHLNNIALEQRNHELEQSNTELASFNHIASHDLQEPLRKIQTFISRILEKESSTLSETAKDYLARTQATAKRMRILVSDLLQFSRTNKSEKIFKKADLNQLLENAEAELLPDIEEKKAVIHHDHLPVLDVIPFQIQELFQNLVANSLKYSRPGVPPVINILCEVADAKEQPVLETKNHLWYYKISIADNGLGFEQKYAENIFQMFYRLHNNYSEYPGSGLGLSICKKIAENHDGTIVASGKPGTGSTFTFYLPL